MDPKLKIVEKAFKNGIVIIPIKSQSKEPLTKWKDVTFPPSFFIQKYPEMDLNIGLNIGSTRIYGKKLICLDFDSPNELLFEEFRQKLSEIGIDPQTVTVKTGGKHGGWHMYYVIEDDDTDDLKNFNLEYKKAHIDVKTNGYTIIPPSKVAKEYKLVFPKAEDIISALTSEHLKSIDLERLKKLRELLNGPDENIIVLKSIEELWTTTKVWNHLIRKAYLEMYGKEPQLIEVG